MPIVPPFDGKILELLRATILELRDLAASNPDEPALTEAAADIERAVSRLEPLAGETKAAT